MTLDNNPASNTKLSNTIKDISLIDDVHSEIHNNPIKFSLHDNDNFKDAIETINSLKINIKIRHL
mgnify:CR=1 FL=1